MRNDGLDLKQNSNMKSKFLLLTSVLVIAAFAVAAVIQHRAIKEQEVRISDLEDQISNVSSEMESLESRIEELEQ